MHGGKWAQMSFSPCVHTAGPSAGAGSKDVDVNDLSSRS